jgi:hypothetical protein
MWQNVISIKGNNVNRRVVFQKLDYGPVRGDFGNARQLCWEEDEREMNWKSTIKKTGNGNVVPVIHILW